MAVRLWLRRGLLIGGAAAALFLGWRVRHELAAAVRDLDPAPFVLSYVLGLVASVLLGRLFAALLGDASGVRLLLGAQLAKYVPGRVWGYVYQASAAAASIPPRRLLLANVDLFALVLIHLTTVALVALTWPGPAAAAVFAGGLLVATAAARSRWAARLVAAAGRRLRFRAEPSDVRRDVSWSRFLALNAAALPVNLAASTLLMTALVPDSPATALRALAAYNLASALSSLVVVVPAGLGVRELLAVGLGDAIATTLPAGAMASLALLVRAWQIAIDLGGALLAGWTGAASARWLGGR